MKALPESTVLTISEYASDKAPTFTVIKTESNWMSIRDNISGAIYMVNRNMYQDRQVLTDELLRLHESDLDNTSETIACLKDQIAQLGHEFAEREQTLKDVHSQRITAKGVELEEAIEKARNQNKMIIKYEETINNLTIQRMILSCVTGIAVAAIVISQLF